MENVISASARAALVPKNRFRAERVFAAVVTLFLIFDGAMHILKPAPEVEAFARLGLPLSLSVPVAIIGLACLAALVNPRATVLGAVLLTGYRGGAVAINLRGGDPLFETLFPVIFGILVWGGVFLREERLGAFLPLQREEKRP